MLFAGEDLSRDGFLGGALHLWQPKQGYRAGVDPVLLAASIDARAGQTVLDLGCGAGAVALCLGRRVRGLKLFGLEMQPDYRELAVRNAVETGQSFDVHLGDVRDMPADLKALSFDHVVANPPYYDRSRGSAAPQPGREAALGEDAPLSDWVKAAAKRLKPWGHFHMILKADRLGDALAALQDHLGSIQVQPLAPRAGSSAVLLILRARKEGRAKLQLHAPIILHAGESHPGDTDHYTAQISDVLRRGGKLEF